MGNMFSLELRPRGKVLKMLRRAQYIKHPSHLPIPVKQKRLGLGVYLSGRDRPRARAAARHAELASRWDTRVYEGDRGPRTQVT